MISYNVVSIEIRENPPPPKKTGKIDSINQFSAGWLILSKSLLPAIMVALIYPLDRK